MAPALPRAASCLDMECVVIVILGLVILLAAVIIGVAGVLGNDGSGHALTHRVLGVRLPRDRIHGHAVPDRDRGRRSCPGRAEPAAGRRAATSRRGSAARRGLRQSVARRPLSARIATT